MISAWPLVRLADLGEVVTGATPKTNDDSFFGGDIPFVTPSELDQFLPVTTASRSLSLAGLQTVRKIPKDAVMVCCIASLGKVGIAGCELATNQQINSIIFNGNKVFPRYGYYACRRLKPELVKFAPATTVPIISKSKFQNFEIPLPPLEEQKRIAAILDQADDIRRKRQHAIERLNQLGQAIFHEMFGDPVKGNGLYPVVSIESIAAPEKYSIVDGPFGSSMKPNDYLESGVPVVRIANITKLGEFTSKNLLYVDKVLFQKLKRSSIKPNDVLVSRVGTIGNTCIFPEGLGDALLSTTGVCKITADKNQLLPEFLHQAILQPTFQAQINKSASTSVQKYFNLSALKSWSISLPPLAVQQIFLEKLTVVKRQEKMMRDTLKNQDNLFSVLQHRAFMGQL